MNRNRPAFTALFVPPLPLAAILLLIPFLVWDHTLTETDLTCGYSLAGHALPNRTVARSTVAAFDPSHICLAASRYSARVEMLVMAAAYSVGLLLTLALALRLRWPANFRTHGKAWPPLLTAGCLLGVAAAGQLAVLLALRLAGIEPDFGWVNTAKLIYFHSWRTALPFLFVGSVLSPVAEEIAWRAWLQRMLGRYLPQWLAIAAQSVLFGLAHIAQGWQGVLTATLGGLAAGIAYHKTGKLWVTVSAHCVLNLVSFAHIAFAANLPGHP